MYILNEDLHYFFACLYILCLGELSFWAVCGSYIKRFFSIHVFFLFIWLCKEERKKIGFGKIRWPSSCLDCTCTCMKELVLMWVSGNLCGWRWEYVQLLGIGVWEYIMLVKTSKMCLVLMPLEMFFLHTVFLSMYRQRKRRHKRSERKRNLVGKRYRKKEKRNG